ncbi:MAG: leucine-rich repeat domain-containing protein [Eubacteriales bacterium]|nr:leucine-rich repeat domain-containing protein [Eubacteriales bacterium]
MKKAVTKRLICLLIACCNLLFLFGCSNPVEGDESSLPPQNSTSDTSPPDTTETPEPLEETKGLTYRLNNEKDGYVLYGIGSNNKKGATIVIPSSHEGLPVTEIAGKPFSGTQVESIYVPESVTVFGDYAFAQATLLKTVILPNNIKIITDKMFQGCKSLTEIVIPDGVTRIGESAFGGCEKLKSITIPSSLTEIGAGAFHQCKALKEIKFPSDISSLKLGAEAFSECTSLRSVKISASTNIKNIPAKAFWKCTMLSEFTFSNSLTKIENDAFVATKLKTIVLPEGLTEIGDRAFTNCDALEELTLPASLKTLGYHPFSSCTAITKLSVASGNSAFRAENNCLISLSDNRLLLGAANAGRIPDGVKIIDDESFVGIEQLEKIIISSSVETIGAGAFMNCKSLKDVTFEANSKLLNIENNAFSSCHALSEIAIPASVKSILDSFTNCQSLKTLKFEGTIAEFSAATGGNVKLPFEDPLYPGQVSCTVICSDGSYPPN